MFFTRIKLKLAKPGSANEKSPGVRPGLTSIRAGNELFANHRYVSFGFLAGDIDVLTHLRDRGLSGTRCCLDHLAFLVFTANDVKASLCRHCGSGEAQQERSNNEVLGHG